MPLELSGQRWLLVLKVVELKALELKAVELRLWLCWAPGFGFLASDVFGIETTSAPRLQRCGVFSLGL